MFDFGHAVLIALIDFQSLEIVANVSRLNFGNS